MTGNAILDATVLADTLGAPLNPGDPPHPPLVSEVKITGIHSDKFAMGYLGGVGTDAQFQIVQCRLPVLPPSSNYDLDARIRASRGLTTGQRLLTRWERPGNFNPGWGTDTWREGENVTWDLTNRGLTDPTTGVMAPVVYPARDPMARDALPPVDYDRNMGLAANTAAPVVLISSLTGAHAGMNMEEMQRVANRSYTAARMKGGLVTRHHRS